MWLLLAATALWGVSFPTVKALYLVMAARRPETDTSVMTGCALAPRFLLGGALLALWLGREAGRLTRRELEQGAALAFFLGGGIFLQNEGLHSTSASVSAFLTQFYVILIPLWPALLARRRPRGRTLAAAVLVLAGVALLGGFDLRDWRPGRGELLTLLSAVFFAGQILCLGAKRYADNSPLKTAMIMLGATGLVFGGWLATRASGAALVAECLSSPAWWTLTAVLTLLCTVGAFGLMNSYQPRVTPTQAGLIYCMEPVFTALWSFFLPGLLSASWQIHYNNEALSGALLLGGGLTVAANVLEATGAE